MLIIIYGHNDTDQSNEKIHGDRYLISFLIDDRNYYECRCHETIENAAESKSVRHENDHIQHTIQSLDQWVLYGYLRPTLPASAS